MSKILDLQGKQEKLRKDLADVFAQAGPDNDFSKVTLLEGDTTAKLERVRAMNDEMSAVAGELKAEQDLNAIRDRANQMAEPVRGAIHPTSDAARRQDEAPRKSLGAQFIESEAYKQRPSGMGYGPQSILDVGLHELGATTFQRSAGWAAESLRTGTVVPIATRPIQVTDLFSLGATDSAAVVYMEETTLTNNAAERAENAAYVESALALTQRTVTVETIGTSLPITDEQLADVSQAASYVDGRLDFLVRQRMDSQLMNGDGSTPNIRGILNASGLQTQAKGADPITDAVYKAMTKVRVTGRAFPSALVIHPDDWTDFRLLRTADGLYIWGNPAEHGPETIWGIQVVQSDTIAVNTAVVGDFSPVMVQLFVRRGMEVQVGYVNDDFKLGKQTVRAGIRVANVIYRGSAYCTITGI